MIHSESSIFPRDLLIAAPPNVYKYVRFLRQISPALISFFILTSQTWDSNVNFGCIFTLSPFRTLCAPTTFDLCHSKKTLGKCLSPMPTTHHPPPTLPIPPTFTLHHHRHYPSPLHSHFFITLHHLCFHQFLIIIYFSLLFTPIFLSTQISSQVSKSRQSWRDFGLGQTISHDAGLGVLANTLRRL